MRIITRITPPGAKKKQKEKPPLRVAAYCRVSTERPEQETSLDLQVRYYIQRIESTPRMGQRRRFCRKGLRAEHKAPQGTG